MARRGSGEGGIFQRESDGRWVATVELGKGPNGKRLRKTVYGSTKRQVQAKLKTAQDARDKGIATAVPPELDSLTLHNPCSARSEELESPTF